MGISILCTLEGRLPSRLQEIQNIWKIVEGNRAREEFQIRTRRGKREQLVDLEQMVKNVEDELEEAEEEVVKAFKEMQMGMMFCRNWIHEVHLK